MLPWCKGNLMIKHDAQTLARGLQSILYKYSTALKEASLVVQMEDAGEKMQDTAQRCKTRLQNTKYNPEKRAKCCGSKRHKI